MAFDPFPKQAYGTYSILREMAESLSIIVVGVGPFISSSLAHKLAAKGWKIALLSRSQEKLDALAKALKDKHPHASILTDTVDAGDADALLAALSKAKEGLGSVDVLCYNAARVGMYPCLYGVQFPGELTFDGQGRMTS